MNVLFRSLRLAQVSAILSLFAVSAFFQPVKAAGAVDIINAHVGKPFTISVRSNPSTGYRWLEDFDREFLKLESSSYEAPSAPRPGKPGRQVFRFVPLKTGKTHIRLQYKRQWESSIAKTKRYSVRIAPGGGSRRPFIDQFSAAQAN